MKFEELNLDERILRAVEDMGFEEASPIQASAIPVIMDDRDVVGQAQTGTGKTAAYSIPVLEKIDPDLKKLQAVILCPTRELAVQVAEEIRKLAKYMSDIKVLPVYGGQEIVRQIKSLKAGVQILVGTPGRVMDHMRKFQKDARIIKVVRKELTVKNIEQYYYEVRPKNKNELLCRLIDIYNPRLSVVFCNTKRQVDELISELKGRGYFADGIHGDMKQAQRDRVMADFRSGKTEILIATDVAARGIDVDDVDVVFNYDLPQDEEYYVHRIGRTGRAGREGVALSFVSGKEAYKLKDIERYCKTKIKAKPIPSMDDVKNTKLEAIFSNIKETIEAGGLSDMVEAVEDRLNMEDYTCLDVAAALLKMVVGDSLEDREELEQVHYDLDADRRGMVRLFINVGKKDKIKPANILGAITGESGIPGKLVGSIDMLDNYTFVEVPSKYADAVLLAMENVTIKGRKISMEKAKGTGRKKKKKR